MPFCPSCGSSVDGRFCAKCGTAVADPAPSGGAYQLPPQQTTVSAAPMADNVASALTYVLGFITGIIFLIVPPYNRNPAVRFHAFQSIFLNVAVFALNIASGIVFSITRLFGILPILSPLIGLAASVLWIYMIVAAYQGKRVVLPVIGDLAAKQAGRR